MILSSCGCQKYVDATFVGPVSKEEIVMARFPIGKNDQGSKSTIEECLNYVRLLDMNCTINTNSATCERKGELLPSYCKVDGNIVSY